MVAADQHLTVEQREPAEVVGAVMVVQLEQVMLDQMEFPIQVEAVAEEAQFPVLLATAAQAAPA